ncbi:MAG: prepilin-type N-terminal cleavage/methylation domain-containing protein [Candidatus Omnitrophica bacterium]|nr:prepilin-type N-terminal cleavage/methylation domain-containing protein [Candidatus Omnitrophota bacterium]
MIKIPLDKKGFTLSELLLSVAMLSVAIPTVLLVFISAVVLNESNSNLCIATGHAQYILEEIWDELNAGGFDSVSTKIDNGEWDWDSNDIYAKGLSALNGESIDTQASSGGTDLLDIVVTVNWLDRAARTRSTYLETYLARQ